MWYCNAEANVVKVTVALVQIYSVLVFTKAAEMQATVLIAAAVPFSSTQMRKWLDLDDTTVKTQPS